MPEETKPYAYSLGPPELFGRLAALAKHHRCWRKVANLVDWMWLTIRARGIPSYGPIFEAEERERFKRSMIKAMRDTKIPADIKIEISRVWRELLIKPQKWQRKSNTSIPGKGAGSGVVKTALFSATGSGD